MIPTSSAEVNPTTYVGQSVRRLEDHRLLIGNGRYLDDLKIPGLLNAAVLRSPHAHASILSIDSSRARQLPGVVSVITADDLTGIATEIPTRTRADADEIHPPFHPVLANDRVCYVGQPVAIVVAETEYLASDALELIDVQYQPLPSIIDPNYALAEGAPVLHEHIGANLALQTLSSGGDLDAAFASADRVVTGKYHVQRLAPAPMEPRGVLADYQRQQDMLTVWDSTQHPHEIRDHLVELLQRPENSVRVIAPDVGGGFGEKAALFPEEVAIPYLSIMLGRPIKWMESRQENMLAFHGRGHTVDVEAAVANDGTLLGIKVSILADLGAYFFMSTPTVPVSTSHRITGPYRTPAMSVQVKGVVTNKTPTGAYRGAGGPEAAFCMERTIDLIAQELGLDPAQVRRRNLLSPDAFPYRTPTGITYDSGNYAPALDRALEMAEYNHWRQRQASSPDSLIGIGLATVVKGSGALTPRLTDYARVIIHPSGEVTLHTGLSPHGQGTATIFAQLAADELGVAPEKVELLHSDTDIVPTGGGTGGSRGLIAGGTAIHLQLKDARTRLIAIAAHVLDCSQEQVTMEDGDYFNQRDPSHRIPFPDVAAAAYDEDLLPPDVEAGLDFSGSNTLPRSPYAFGAHVAVVEVSRDTGEVNLLKYVAVHDAGRIMNPMLADGQVHGAIVQGVGQALLEGMAYDSEGQPLTGSLLDYSLPTSSTMPAMELDTLETMSPLTPSGLKGIGELPTLAAPVAVANAVMDALSPTGIRHIDTPLTPDKLERALRSRRSEASGGPIGPR